MKVVKQEVYMATDTMTGSKYLKDMQGIMDWWNECPEGTYPIDNLDEMIKISQSMYKWWMKDRGRTSDYGINSMCWLIFMSKINKPAFTQLMIDWKKSTIVPDEDTPDA